jgi:hypothetical protein
MTEHGKNRDVEAWVDMLRPGTFLSDTEGKGWMPSGGRPVPPEVIRARADEEIQLAKRTFGK